MRDTVRKAVFTGLLAVGGMIGLGTSPASAQVPVPPAAVTPAPVYQTPGYYTTVPQYRYVYRPRMGYRFAGGRRYFYGGPRYNRVGRRFGWRRFR